MKISFTKMLAFCCVFLLCVMAVRTIRADELENGFNNPPNESRMKVFWWWLDGNVTKRAITRDLEQMKAKGIGGALIFDADGSGAHGNQQMPVGPTFNSPQWRELFRHALSEAGRLGIELSLSIQSGWNLGGPPVAVDRAAKMLVFSQSTVRGPGKIEIRLPRPKTRVKYGFDYWDEAVVAFPAPKTEHAPIGNLRAKTVNKVIGGSAPDCGVLLKDRPASKGEQVCKAAEVRDLTGNMDADGTLCWDAPPGEWIVLRVGYAPTGMKICRGSGKWKGLVLDYLSANDLRWYWKTVVEPLLDDAGPLAEKTLKYVHTDSWECKSMNWTPGFRREFQNRRGYELLPYLPVMAGYIIGDRATANRFLADFRKTIGDCIAENHYRVLRELAERRGMGIHPESGGPHAAPIDSLRLMGNNNLPMAEFWAKSWRHRVTDEERFFVKQPASAAHTYGRRLVGAESFTTMGPHWQETIWSNLRPSFDRAACEGMNMTFWHTFTCSPKEMGTPGQEYHAGTHFNPQITWWPMADAFTSYINRCQFMLQQGLFVGDAVYYYGDHVPNFTQLKQSDPARVLPGYDYDVATEEVVLDRMEVKDGRIVLPDGMSYAVLVMPPLPAVSLPVLRKIEQLVKQGATVVGPKPQRASGLGKQPQNDQEVRRIADRLWGEDGQGRRIGKGRVIANRTAREVFQADGVPPDFDYEFLPTPNRAGAATNLPSPRGRGAGGEGLSLDYIHRRDGDTDIYFVRNCGDKQITVDALFRVADKRPEHWNPIDGTMCELPEYRTGSKQTIVPLQFEPYGSYFIVFRKKNDQPQSTDAKNFQKLKPLKTIDGPWRVSFDPRWGGPENVTFDKLVDWTARPEEGIKHYSGTAVYRKTIKLSAETASRKKLYLDLGSVKELARVRLNGRDLGVVWCPPWRVDISAAALPGENRLEIEAVNFWPNRIIGDAKLPPEKRLTRTNICVLKSDTPLMPSGLLGPVRIDAGE